MLVRLPGWGDADVWALLALIRKHLLLYVYASDSDFVEAVRAELPEKAAHEILEMVRSLMLQLGLGLDTKNFHTDVIVPNGQEVYVYEHIYESISQLPENKAGGVWLPDDLSRFLQKAKQYRGLFTSSQDVYFKRVQVWGKSVAESKSKFYALREIFIREKRRSRQRKAVDAKRLQLLREIFTGVSPVRRAEKVEVPSKAPKMWSPEDMATLVDFIVRITREIQSTGSSDLVSQVAETLHRTDGSCVNKLADMRDKFLKKSAPLRAANLPDTVYDPHSEANKIFNADWCDNNDPYALGYLAIKSRSLRLTAERNRKRRRKSIWSSRPKLRSAARGTSTPSANQTDAPTQSATTIKAPKPVTRMQSESHPSDPPSDGAAAGSRSQPAEIASANTLSASDYVAFVRDIAVQCEWAEKLVYNVLHSMQHSIDLYRSNKFVEFFCKIASLTPGVTLQDLFADAVHIITEFEKRFGTLDGFEYLILTAPDVNPSMAISDQETKEQDHALDNVVNSIGTPVDTQNNAIADYASDVCSPEGIKVDGDERDRDQSPIAISPAQESPTLNDDTAVYECERNQFPLDGSPDQILLSGDDDAAMAEDEYEHEQSSLVESPVHTPQTGNENAVDEHSSSMAGKQSSPEDTWDDGVDADADLDDDGLDNQSVGSSDNAWSGSSNISDAKESHCATGKSAVNDPYPLLGHFDSSKKPSKRGKDEQYGKNFDLAKKRRLDVKKPTAIKHDDEEDEDGADEGDDDDGELDDETQSEDADEVPPLDNESISSDGELEETPHPLQSILNSLDSHIDELREKQRKLIDRKEDREWRQRQYADREYGFHLSMHSFASRER